MDTIPAPSISVFQFIFFSSRRRHTRFDCDWSSDVCSSDLDRSKWKGQGRSGLRGGGHARSEEHTSELQSQSNLVCRLLLEKKKKPTEKERINWRMSEPRNLRSACADR